MLSQNMGSKYLLYFTVLCVLYCAAMSCFCFLRCNDVCFSLASAACILSLQGICSACFAQRAYGPGRHQGGFGSDHHGPQDSSSSCKKHKTSFYKKNKQQNTTILETTKTSFGIGTVLYSTSCAISVVYCTVLYCTVLYYTVLRCTVLYLEIHCKVCTVLQCIVLYCTIVHCTVL